MPNEVNCGSAGVLAGIESMTLPEAVRRVEMDRISDALKQCNGTVRKAARLLGLTERMLAYKIQKYNIIT